MVESTNLELYLSGMTRIFEILPDIFCPMWKKSLHILCSSQCSKYGKIVQYFKSFFGMVAQSIYLENSVNSPKEKKHLFPIIEHRAIFVLPSNCIVLHPESIFRCSTSIYHFLFSIRIYYVYGFVWQIYLYIYYIVVHRIYICFLKELGLAVEWIVNSKQGHFIYLFIFIVLSDFEYS